MAADICPDRRKRAPMLSVCESIFTFSKQALNESLEFRNRS